MVFTYWLAGVTGLFGFVKPQSVARAASLELVCFIDTNNPSNSNGN